MSDNVFPIRRLLASTGGEHCLGQVRQIAEGLLKAADCALDNADLSCAGYEELRELRLQTAMFLDETAQGARQHL